MTKQGSTATPGTPGLLPPVYGGHCSECNQISVCWGGLCNWCRHKIGPRHSTPTMMSFYHVKFAIARPKGLTKEQFDNARDLLHVLMKEADSDYPFDPMRKAGDTIEICGACKGLVWRQPQLTPSDFKRAARQLGLVFKVAQWRRGDKCKDATISRVQFSPRLYA